MEWGSIASRTRSLALVGLVAVVLVPGAAHALVAQMSLQGVLLTDGTVALDGAYDLRVSLHDAPSEGTEVWFETLAGVEAQGGVFSVILGESTPLPVDPFATVAQLWLEVQVLGGPGVVEPEIPLPRRPLTTVAYAFAAQRAFTANWALDAESANDLDCGAGGCVSVGELDFDPALQSELDAVQGELEALGGTVADVGDLAAADSDPANELQTLSHPDGQICISHPDAAGGLCVDDGDTLYTAGAGLELSAANQLSVSPSYALPQGCQVDQVARWTGTAWECAPPDFGIPSGFCMFSPKATECPMGWTRVSVFDGKALQGATTAGNTGGADTHVHDTAAHTLTVAEMPSHSHPIRQSNWQNGNSEGGHRQGDSAGGLGSFATEATGGGQPHSHGATTAASSWPPYITVLICCKD